MVQLKSVAASEIQENPKDTVTGVALPYPKVRLLAVVIVGGRHSRSPCYLENQ